MPENDTTSETFAHSAADFAPVRQGWAKRTTVLVAFLAFAIGAAVTGWLANEGKLRIAVPGGGAAPIQLAATDAADTDAPAPNPKEAAAMASAVVGGVETRLALLEERMARLDLEANAASGHAARAEGLLIAFAARRVIAKGSDLGFVEDQLKLRFGGAQPEAVRTVITFARAPVTLDQLVGGLDALAPVLVDAPHGDSGWGWLKQQMSGLFVVRRATTPTLSPADRVQRAKILLGSGKTQEAIEEIEKMPGAENAQAWIESARRYDRAQQALDVIETAAMLEPRRLHDAQGRAIDEPSPLAQPADTAGAGAPAADPKAN